MAPNTGPMTAREAAARLGVDPATIRRWVSLGLIPAIRTPLGQYRLTDETVTRLATERLEPTAA